MPAHDLLRQAELPADLAHFVLEELAQRLDQLPRKVRSQAPHVMMRLDRDRWAAERRGGLDHVGIQRSLHQESDIPGHVFGRRLEYVDERVADAAPLLFRVFDPRQHLEKARLRLDDPQIDAEVCPERPLYLLALVEPQQTVVHEDAGQPVADRALDQGGRYGRIHAAREAADRPLFGTDELSNPPHLLLDEVTRRPIGRAAGDLE